MRSLTLTQPWCGLVASGIKLVENRPRPMIKREDFGEPFALHASREIDDATYGRLRELAPDLFDGELWEQPWYKLSRITSAVIATATIRDALYVGGCTPEAILAGLDRLGLADQARFTFGPTVYVLGGAPAVLRAPVPCRGWQGFWTLPDDVAARVEEQLR